MPLTKAGPQDRYRAKSSWPRAARPDFATRVRWRGLEPPRGFNPTRPSTLRVYQFRHQRAARIVAAPPRLDICRATIYLRDTYEPDGSHTGATRNALARAPVGVRHQGDRRPLDAVLLG